MSVSERIFKRREELKLTQTELAKRAGLKPPAISQYESGLRSPSYEALIKLSNALGLSTDYLISGSETKSDTISEKTAKILFNIIQEMSVENREKLLQYASFLTNIQLADFDIPLLNGPSDYADYVHKNYSSEKLPVNVFEIASKLGISVYKDDLEGKYEGLLIKNAGKYIAILDKKIDFERRIKFTLAILIGHAVIPWHIKTNYFVRKKGTSTLHTENSHEIEAQIFAAYLIMPQTYFIKDIGKDRIGMQQVKEIAEKKYDVSVTAFLNHMVDIYGEKFACAQSKMGEVLKSYQGDRPLVEKVNEKSIACSFYNDPIPLKEEIREGEVPASYWFTDAEDNEKVFESSIFNPVYGSILSLVSR